MSQRAVDGEDRVAQQRRLIRELVAPTDPADAMTAYYALEHPAQRVQLTVHHTPAGRPDGFLALCQTGRELFVPLVVMRGAPAVAQQLVRRALQPGREYLLVVPPDLGESLLQVLEARATGLNLIHTLDPSAFRPVLNVMVQPGSAAHRYEIRSQGQVVAAAGVNWRAYALADVYVYTADDFQGRGWGRAVGSACVRSLLEEGVLPLYTAAEGNGASLALAGALGFRDAGARELEMRAVRRDANGSAAG